MRFFGIRCNPLTKRQTDKHLLLLIKTRNGENTSADRMSLLTIAGEKLPPFAKTEFGNDQTKEKQQSTHTKTTQRKKKRANCTNPSPELPDNAGPRLVGQLLAELSVRHGRQRVLRLQVLLQFVREVLAVTWWDRPHSTVRAVYGYRGS